MKVKVTISKDGKVVREFNALVEEVSARIIQMLLTTEQGYSITFSKP